MASRMMAPTTDAMNPADCPSWYQPTACPRYLARREPAMPMMIVTMNPPGSFPGMMNFAMAPTTRPITIAQMMCIAPPQEVMAGARPGGSAAPNTMRPGRRFVKTSLPGRLPERRPADPRHPGDRRGPLPAGGPVTPGVRSAGGELQGNLQPRGEDPVGLLEARLRQVVVPDEVAQLHAQLPGDRRHQRALGGEAVALRLAEVGQKLRRLLEVGAGGEHSLVVSRHSTQHPVPHRIGGGPLLAE